MQLVCSSYTELRVRLTHSQGRHGLELGGLVCYDFNEAAWSLTAWQTKFKFVISLVVKDVISRSGSLIQA